MSCRVLALTPDLDPLGAAAVFFDAAPDLAARGFDLHIASPDRPDSLRSAPLDGCETIRLSRRFDPFELRRLAGRLRPDLIHDWTGGKGWTRRKYFGWLAFSVGSRLLNGVHDLLPAGNDAGCGDAELAEIRRRILFGSGTDSPGPKPAAEKGARPAGGHKELWNRTGIDVLPDAQVILAAAPLSADSRIKDLVWAVDLLTCIRDDVHLIVLGEGRARGRIEWFARQTEAASHIHLPGPRAAWRELVAACDMVWLPTADAAAAMVAREAILAQKPLIAAAVAGWQGLLFHQQTALLVPPGSRDGYARWTKFLLERAPDCRQLTEQSYAWLARQAPERTGSVADLIEGSYRRTSEVQPAPGR